MGCVVVLEQAGVAIVQVLKMLVKVKHLQIFGYEEEVFLSSASSKESAQDYSTSSKQRVVTREFTSLHFDECIKSKGRDGQATLKNSEQAFPCGRPSIF